MHLKQRSYALALGSKLWSDFLTVDENDSNLAAITNRWRKWRDKHSQEMVEAAKELGAGIFRKARKLD